MKFSQEKRVLTLLSLGVGGTMCPCLCPNNCGSAASNVRGLGGFWVAWRGGGFVR